MRCVWEHNGNDTLLYSVDYIGAYTRGASLEIAMAKMASEIEMYSYWSGLEKPSDANIEIVQEMNSTLQIADADSDVLFDSERVPLSREEYEELKNLALKSAYSFLSLYESIPNKCETCLPERRTFYGYIPRTAQEMYEHTKNVNAYYFGEIGINANNEGTILDCRKQGVERLEQSKDFLSCTVTEGSYGELWTLRKVIRRFLWHDRIHGKAMYRMAAKTFGSHLIANPFKFPGK